MTDTSFQKTEIIKLPNVLIMHLMRFTFDMNWNYQKVNSRFEYPLELNMEKHTTKLQNVPPEYY